MIPSDVYIQSLSSRPEHIELVARWYFDEWVQDTQTASIEDVIANLSESLDSRVLPITFVAYIEDVLVGAAQLKIREMREYAHFKFWLGGVYVDFQWRGETIATQLVAHCLQEAKCRELTPLYLQTQRMDGGLYKHLGWMPVFQATRREGRVLVMENQLL